MCCTWLAENTGRKKVAKNRHLGTIAELCRAVSSQLRHISTIGKKYLLSSNTSSTCPHNMVNFCPLAAEIVSLVWGTPSNFNRFRVLAALLHGTLVVGVSQTAALNRGRHLYSAGRPSRWALAHISSLLYFEQLLCVPSDDDDIWMTLVIISCSIQLLLLFLLCDYSYIAMLLYSLSLHFWPFRWTYISLNVL